MLAAGSTLGIYKVLAPLGAGGMGEVYRAHDPRLQRDIGLKVLPDSLTTDATARARLIREARSAAALSHPNICTVHEVGEADGHVYIAMELVEGQPLSERIGGKPLPVENVVRYGAQIAEALAHAHERHVIHRDLKSGNVMVTADGRVKVLDFGLAKRAWDVDENALTPQVTLTETGAVVGTPHYLAPEVLHGEKADAVSDVWALGVVLYEMTSGTLPFRGGTSYELSAAILNETPAPLPERVQAGLRAVIAGCLAKQPGERSQRAGEVRAALEALQAGVMPVGTPAAEERVAPRRRRPRVAIAPLAIAVIVLVAAAAAWLTRERWLPRPRLREVQLTNPSWEISLSGAAISPDGRMLLYDDWRGLHLMDPATKETHDVSLPAPLRGEVIVYSWRPESRSFVIGPYDERKAGAGLWEIAVLSGKATQIRATGSRPMVSPDGQSIVFVDKRDRGMAELWVTDAAGVGAHKLADVVDFQEMGWSPDGKRLAVVEYRAGLTIFDAQQGSRWRVLKDRRFDWGASGVGIAWIEPRRLVVSMADSTTPTAPMNLYELRLDGRGTRVIGEPRRLTDWRDASVSGFSFTSDHRKVVLLRGWIQSDVYWADIAPGGKRLGDLKRLTLDNGDKFPIGWTLASDGVILVSGARTYRQPLDSPTAELVDERYRSWCQRWDGGNWLYELRASGSLGQWAGATIQLTRTLVGGGAAEIVKEWRPTAHADSAGWYVRFDLPPIEGVAGVVVEWVDSALVISRLDPKSGSTSERMRLPMESDPRSALSRDGERLVLTHGLATIDLVDLRASRVSAIRPRPTGAGIVADSLVAQSVVWLPQGDAVLVGTYSPGGLWRVELNGRATRLYASRDYKNPWVGALQLSPDGRKIALARLTAQSNAWLLEGLK